MHASNGTVTAQSVLRPATLPSQPAMRPLAATRLMDRTLVSAALPRSIFGFQIGGQSQHRLAAIFSLDTRTLLRESAGVDVLFVPCIDAGVYNSTICSDGGYQDFTTTPPHFVTIPPTDCSQQGSEGACSRRGLSRENRRTTEELKCRGA